MQGLLRHKTRAVAVLESKKMKVKMRMKVKQALDPNES